MRSAHPPVGPTEAEVRDHFRGLLLTEEKLMRPAYTSIWALEDGTLLWDWKNGYARIGTALNCVMYVTGPAGSGKTCLVSQFENAKEISVRSVLSQMGSNLSRKVEENTDYKTLAFTSQAYRISTDQELRRIAEELGIQFFNINLTRK